MVRPWTAADLEPLVRHANNPRVAIHLRDRFPHPYRRQDGQRFLTAVLRAARPTVWCIEVDGQAAGGIGIELRDDVERVSAEIGYWLGEACWGRGVTTAALVAVTDEAFRMFDLRRLFAVPFAENAASVRVLEKAGYVLEGHMRQSAVKDGRLLDQLMYAKYR
ncbi:MAG: GNAT family N-acetyltransferase [Vicinamibacterales bacterium]